MGLAVFMSAGRPGCRSGKYANALTPACHFEGMKTRQTAPMSIRKATT